MALQNIALFILLMFHYLMQPYYPAHKKYHSLDGNRLPTKISYNFAFRTLINLKN